MLNCTQPQELTIQRRREFLRQLFSQVINQMGEKSTELKCWIHPRFVYNITCLVETVAIIGLHFD